MCCNYWCFSQDANHYRGGATVSAVDEFLFVINVHGLRRILNLAKSITELVMQMGNIKRVGVRESYHKTLIENGKLPKKESGTTTTT